jgi:IMP dehydrogenase
MLYSLDEICLIPAIVSGVEHRKDVVVFDNHNRFPLFTAPMSCIVNHENYETFKEHNINVIIPRTVAWEARLIFLRVGEWTAVGLEEAKYLLENLVIEDDIRIRLCIDQANGHMESLLKVCADLKDKFGDHIRLMTGNIANPNTYKEYARAGVDFLRASIGSGNVCTTSVQTGMHYPMGSLLIKLKEEKDLVETAIRLGAQYRSIPKIVADGGFKRIDQIVKALALGADYVMLGEILAKSEEACGPILENNENRMREYFGMSTERAQYLVNAASLNPVENFTPKHSEGQIKYTSIDYTLKEWTADFEHALRSSMSYAGARLLKEYIGKVNWDTMTPVTYYAYMK